MSSGRVRASSSTRSTRVADGIPDAVEAGADEARGAAIAALSIAAGSIAVGSVTVAGEIGGTGERDERLCIAAVMSRFFL